MAEQPKKHQCGGSLRHQQPAQPAAATNRNLSSSSESVPERIETKRKKRRTHSPNKKASKKSRHLEVATDRPSGRRTRRSSQQSDEPKKSATATELIQPLDTWKTANSRDRKHSVASLSSVTSSSTSSGTHSRAKRRQRLSPQSIVAAENRRRSLRSNPEARLSLVKGLPYYPEHITEQVTAATNKDSRKSKSRKHKTRKAIEELKKLASGKSQPGPSTNTDCPLPKKRVKLFLQQQQQEKALNLSTKHKASSRKRSKTGSCASSSRSCALAATAAATAAADSSSSRSSNKPASATAMSDPPDHPDQPIPAAAAGAAATASNSAAGASAMPATEADESDVGRLQALLEARGLSSHLFGTLGPRMHQLLHRSMGGGTMSKVQQLLQGLQATGDEGQQLTAVIEMCQLLVMGNEDTLAGFPVKQVVPALISLLQMEHNFDMMHHACRALTYMMEALPRSSAVVVDAVPVFLEKLQVIQCMDVAEQSLQALEMLSRRHSKAILHANGISACLMYVDFFSISAQRAALAVTANACQNMNSDEFHYVRESLSLLSGRLAQHDKKSVDSVCVCFSRLVDNFQTDERVLKEIAAHGLLAAVQQLLIVSPAIITSTTFVMVMHMLLNMCASCPDLAVVLLKQNIAETLCYLLVGSERDGKTQHSTVELMQRSPQELDEIVGLIGELMPKLPTNGIFCVDQLLKRAPSHNMDPVIWQWKDDRGMWHPYTLIDSRIVEAAYQCGEDEVALTIRARTYTLDFNSLQQINEDSGTARSVQRKANPLAAPASVSAPAGILDCRADVLAENAELAASFIRTLFAIVYEVYSSSAGPSVRHRCLAALLRMLYFAPAPLLRSVLHKLAISSQIAAMMASHDLKLVVVALQMAYILIDKLPDVFSVYFRREGVMHQIRELCDRDTLAVTPKKADIPHQQPSTSSSAAADCTDSLLTPPPEKPSSPTPQMRLSDVLKRKKPPKRGGRKGSRQEEAVDALSKGAAGRTPTTRGKASAAGKDSKSSGATPKTSFLASLNPSRWGRSTGPPKDAPLPPVLTSKPLTPSTVTNNKDKIKQWIRDQAVKFSELYFGSEKTAGSHPALSVLNRLCAATDSLQCLELSSLRDIASILGDSDVSLFEIIHSGLVDKLLAYLVATDDEGSRPMRLRRFLHVFLHCPPPEVTVVKELDNRSCPPLTQLVSKLMGCFHHLEQLQVKVHDLPGGSSSSSGSRGSNALRFFNTHQLKCNLQRHPDCKTLRQWKGGPVKIDPLALVQAIERYLVMQGYGRVAPEGEEDCSDDENSEEDIDDTMAAVSISHGTARHKLRFLIGSTPLNYNMTVYQAIKQHSQPADAPDTDTDSEHPFGPTGIWVDTHTIWYKPASDEDDEDGASNTNAVTGIEMASSPKKTKSDKPSKHSPKCKKNELWTDGICPEPTSLLDAFLNGQLPVTISDPSLPVLALLRLLHALNKHWTDLYETQCNAQNSIDFVSTKLMAKANRQLQDPLVIMTGNLPGWLTQLGYTCPFLLPFDTRQLLFYATAFDRDRAMQRLQDMSAEAVPADSTERVTPRIDKRKRVVSRDDLLRQAEKVMDEVGTSRALLEIQYDNEVGTGLGPTLEFYALVSRQLQRVDLDLWRGTSLPDGDDESTLYVFSPNGLYPAPIGRHVKSAHIYKLQTKFRFIGKLMAKAVMDSRMLDLPLSMVVYKWLLYQEHTLSAADLQHIDPGLASTYHQLDTVLRQKKRILADHTHTDESRRLALESLTLEGGGTIDDLALDFVLPGYPHIDLRRGGRYIAVTLDNLDCYLQLLLHWTLVEGVAKQMEALREGFAAVFPLSHLALFYPAELDRLVCGSGHTVWDKRLLAETCRLDHGYSQDSPAVHYLFDILSNYDAKQQRLFLQFVTGSPRLPVGGLRSLNPPLTIVRKSVEDNGNPDSYLPSVMTCVNYLKLPDYSTIDVMRDKLALASREGQLSFHLS